MVHGPTGPDFHFSLLISQTRRGNKVSAKKKRKGKPTPFPKAKATTVVPAAAVNAMRSPEPVQPVESTPVSAPEPELRPRMCDPHARGAHLGRATKAELVVRYKTLMKSHNNERKKVRVYWVDVKGAYLCLYR